MPRGRRDTNTGNMRTSSIPKTGQGTTALSTTIELRVHTEDHGTHNNSSCKQSREAPSITQLLQHKMLQ